jgi:hypothetical protein
VEIEIFMTDKEVVGFILTAIELLICQVLFDMPSFGTCKMPILERPKNLTKKKPLSDVIPTEAS